MSDQAIQAIVTISGAVISLIGTVFVAYMALLMSREKKATHEKLDGITSVTKETRTWVNSLMGVQLKLNAYSTRRLADIAVASNLSTKQVDVEAANRAESMLKEHEEQQAKVDAAKNKTAQG